MSGVLPSLDDSVLSAGVSERLAELSAARLGALPLDPVELAAIGESLWWLPRRA
ncbi:MAG TPA: hypothetical protein VNK73_13810 [Actinomycetota bacterium]|nr:hypothetical protein [Actinomycetota bacterium]